MRRWSWVVSRWQKLRSRQLWNPTFAPGTRKDGAPSICAVPSSRARFVTAATYAAFLGVGLLEVADFFGSKTTAAASRIPIRPKQTRANRAIMRTGMGSSFENSDTLDSGVDGPGVAVTAITNLRDPWAVPDFLHGVIPQFECMNSSRIKPATLGFHPRHEEAERAQGATVH